MICLIQRVSQARVEVDQQVVGQIQQGLLVFVGFHQDDHGEKIPSMAHKLCHYRLFGDDQGKMNLNVQDVQGGILLVPQFTLAANTQKGLRPSFSSAKAPEQAAAMFNDFVCEVGKIHPQIAQGVFGANMQVSLTNSGPVTFWLEN